MGCFQSRLKYITQHIGWLMCALCLPLHAAQPMVLGVPNFKPYSYLSNQQIIGSAINPVTQALNDSHIKPTIRLYANYSLLLKALRKDEIQGFFLASKNLERDKYAVFSKPITFNNWTWFTLKNAPFNLNGHQLKLKGTVGTIMKTNTYRWLSRAGYQVISSSVEDLPNLLINKKVDAVFAAQAVFEIRARELNIRRSFFIKKIEQKKPFAIYISKRFLEEHEGFMERLNGNITTR